MKDLHERLENSTAMNLIQPNEFLGALVSAGSSLIGGLLGKAGKEDQRKKDLRDQAVRNQLNFDLIASMNADVRARAEAAAKIPIVTTTEGYDNSTITSTGSVDIAAMMKAASDSGFNPVTFLRNGGMAAYAKTVTDNQRKYSETQTVTGAHNMDAALAGQQIFQHGAAPSQMSVPSTGEVFGNAITSGANAWLQNYNQIQQNEFQSKLLDAQLAGNNQAAAQRARGMGGSGNSNYDPRRSGNVPQAHLNGDYSTGKGNAAMSSKSKIPDLYTPYIDNSAGGNGRTVWLPNPDIADSEQLAAAIAGSAAGPWQQQPATHVDNRKVQLQFVNPVTSQPGGGATLGDIGNALSKYFEPWWNNQPIPGTSW